MSRDADSIPWGRVRPRVEALIEERTRELVQAPLDQVLRLQAEIKALGNLPVLFEQFARETRIPSEPDDNPGY